MLHDAKGKDWLYNAVLSAFKKQLPENEYDPA
jgi:hypothetical protein